MPRLTAAALLLLLPLAGCSSSGTSEAPDTTAVTTTVADPGVIPVPAPKELLASYPSKPALSKVLSERGEVEFLEEITTVVEPGSKEVGWSLATTGGVQRYFAFSLTPAQAEQRTVRLWIRVLMYATQEDANAALNLQRTSIGPGAIYSSHPYAPLSTDYAYKAAITAPLVTGITAAHGYTVTEVTFEDPDDAGNWLNQADTMMAQLIQTVMDRHPGLDG